MQGLLTPGVSQSWGQPGRGRRGRPRIAGAYSNPQRFSPGGCRLRVSLVFCGISGLTARLNNLQGQVFRAILPGMARPSLQIPQLPCSPLAPWQPAEQREAKGCSPSSGLRTSGSEGFSDPPGVLSPGSPAQAPWYHSGFVQKGGA